MNMIIFTHIFFAMSRKHFVYVVFAVGTSSHACSPLCPDYSSNDTMPVRIVLHPSSQPPPKHPLSVALSPKPANHPAHPAHPAHLAHPALASKRRWLPPGTGFLILCSANCPVILPSPHLSLITLPSPFPLFPPAPWCTGGLGDVL